MSGLDEYVKLLLHFDGPNNGTNFVDSSYGAKAVTRYGDTKIVTAQSKFGGASGYLDGNGDYLTVADSNDWDFGTGDFTIDFWWRPAVLPSVGAGQWFIGQYQNAANRWNMYVWNGAAEEYQLCWYLNIGNSVKLNLGYVVTLNTGQWYHVAFVRNGNTFLTFLDGELKGTNISAESYGTFSAVLTVGQQGDGQRYINGYLDELRISKGIARWTSNFTPPSAPYSPDIPVATLQITQKEPTRIARTYSSSRTITIIPYDASEHPVELAFNATARQASYYKCNAVILNFEGYGVSGNVERGIIDATIRGVTVESFIGHRILEGDIPKITLEAHGSVSDVWDIDIRLSRITGELSGSQEIKAYLSKTLSPVTLSSVSPLTDVIGQISGTLNPIVLTTQIQGNVGLDWSLDFTLPKIRLSANAIHDVYGFINQTLDAIGVELEIDSLVFETIVMNLLNKAVTNFTNYPFNSFCHFNGKYYGCARDGLYELVGIDDFGSDIAAYIETGFLDLEVKALQRIRHAYLGFKSNGILTLTITTDDGLSYSYTTENITTNNHGQKVKFGKGFKDRYIKIKIANTDGCAFSIDKARVFDEPISHRRR